MTSPAQETDPVQVVTEYGQAVLPQAVAARIFEVPPRTAAPEEFRDALLRCRAQLDRLEELLGGAQALAGEVRRTAAEMEQAAELAWDTVVDGIPPGHRLRQEYTSAKERQSYANLQALPARRRARQWAKAADLAKDLAERIRLMHRGLDGTRQDLHRVLGHFTLERSLDR